MLSSIVSKIFNFYFGNIFLFLFKNTISVTLKNLVKIILLFLLSLYFIAVDLTTNVFICSYLKFNFFNNTAIFNNLYFLVLFFIFILNLFVIKNKASYNSDFVRLSFYFYFFSFSNLLILFNYMIKYLINFFLYLRILASREHNIMTSWVLYIWNKAVDGVHWFPIFNRRSYFGLFRLIRQRRVELNSKGLDRLKY